MFAIVAIDKFGLTPAQNGYMMSYVGCIIMVIVAFVIFSNCCRIGVLRTLENIFQKSKIQHCECVKVKKCEQIS